MEFTRFESSEKKENSIQVEWRFSTRCNFECSYCDPQLHNKISPILSKEHLKLSTDQLIDWCFPKYIQLSIAGGEPFVQKNIHWWLEYLHAKDISHIHISSNGSSPLQSYLKSLKYIDSLTISYHFERENTDELITKIIQIKEQMPSNKSLGVYFMLTPGKLNRTRELVKTLSRHQIKHSVRKIKLINSHHQVGWDSDSTDYYNYEEKQYLQKFISPKKNIIGTLESGNQREFNWNDIVSRGLNKYFGWNCSVGDESLLILENGDVFRGFCEIGGKVGNLLDERKPYTKTVTCTNEWCSGGLGLAATKYKP